MKLSESEYHALQARMDVSRGKLAGQEVIITSKSAPVERELHDQIEAELKRRGFYYIHSRMDRPSTNQVGTPDFIVAAPNGITLWMEVKRPGSKPTREQAAAGVWLQKLLHRHAVVTSMEEALSFLNG